MTRRFLAAAIAGALAAAPVPLLAQTSLDVAAGPNAPVGHLGDIAYLGYNIALGVILVARALPVGLRLEGGYNSFGLTGSNGDVRIISGTGNAIFNVGPTRDAPYLIAGLGIYNRSFGANSLFFGDNRTTVGLNGGGGLRFPLTGINTFFEARYHVMLGNARDGTNYQFIPITFGIIF
jgi:hypothetical protein